MMVIKITLRQKIHWKFPKRSDFFLMSTAILKKKKKNLSEDFFVQVSARLSPQART